MNQIIIKISTVFYLLLVLSSCYEQSLNTKEYKIHSLDSTTSTPINDTRLIDSLKFIILDRGDSVIYNLVHSYYALETRNSEFLYYSMIMAHKYNNADAYFDTFFSLSESAIDNDLSNLDVQTKYLALYYLLRSYELGVKNASYYVKDIFGEAPVPESRYYLLELSKIK